MITLPFTLSVSGPGVTSHAGVEAPFPVQVMGLVAMTGGDGDVAVLTDAIEAGVAQPVLWAEAMATAEDDVRVLRVMAGRHLVVAPKELTEERTRAWGTRGAVHVERVITGTRPWKLSELGPTTWPWPAGVATRLQRGQRIEIEAIVRCTVACAWLCRDDSSG